MANVLLVTEAGISLKTLPWVSVQPLLPAACADLTAGRFLLPSLC